MSEPRRGQFAGLGARKGRYFDCGQRLLRNPARTRLLDLARKERRRGKFVVVELAVVEEIGLLAIVVLRGLVGRRTDARRERQKTGGRYNDEQNERDGTRENKGDEFDDVHNAQWVAGIRKRTKRAIKARKRYEAVVYQIPDSGVSPQPRRRPRRRGPGSRYRAGRDGAAAGSRYRAELV